MNSATGDDLSINASYAAECISTLFELFVQETISPKACGKFHREAVRAEQLAYKLMVASETLQNLGVVAKGLASRLSPQGTALISCLYIESSSLYPALRAAAEETLKKRQPDSWIWLESIEHQDWLRSHLACLEGLARVLCLALTSRRSLQDQHDQPFMEPARQHALHDAQLSSAIKRFSLACDTSHLNLRTLELTGGDLGDLWQTLPWKLIKPSESIKISKDVVSPICRWMVELGRKCGRKPIDTFMDDWEAERAAIRARLLTGSEPNSPLPQKEMRRSNVHRTADKRGRPERGSSPCAFTGTTEERSANTSSREPQWTPSVASSQIVRPEECTIFDNHDASPSPDNPGARIPLSRSQKDCNEHAMQPPLFADQNSLSKHLKPMHRQSQLQCPYLECFQGSEKHFNSEQELIDHLRIVHHERSRWQEENPDLKFSLSELGETPPTRTSTPAIDIPQRNPRPYLHVPLSPTMILSPMISPTDRSAFSPLGSGSDLSAIIDLSILLERDIKPTLYTFLRQRPVLLPRSYRKGSPDSREEATKEYYAILDRVINDVIQPANRIVLDTEGNKIAQRERKRLVREAKRMLDMLEHWAGEDKSTGFYRADLEGRRGGQRSHRYDSFSTSPAEGERRFGRSY